MAAIENVNTLDERRSKIVRNRVIDCCLSPDRKLFLVAIVSDCFGYVFSKPLFNKHFSRRQSKTLILATNVDLRSLEREFLMPFDVRLATNTCTVSSDL